LTNRETVAYAELTRVLPWSLRALGYAFGTADRAAFLVANAASMDPGVLDAIAAADERPEGALRHVADGTGLALNAGGVSLLEAGPSTMDYLAAHARPNQNASCRIVGATQTELMPATLLVGVDYGLSSVAVERGPGGLNWHVLEAGAGSAQLVSGQGMAPLVQWLAGALSKEVGLRPASRRPTLPS
jgi:hypothetical protein